MLKSCENNVGDRREECVRELVDLLYQLLPSSKMKDITANVFKFMDSAIKLKNHMTEEQAVYRCFMLSYGETVTNEQLHIGDEDVPGGVLFLCTFPGLYRIVLNEDGEKEVLTVVKASGILNTGDQNVEGNEVNNEKESSPENVKKDDQGVDGK